MESNERQGSTKVSTKGLVQNYESNNLKLPLKNFVTDI